MTTKPNRNDPCPCGSGRKYKQCCLLNESAAAAGQAELNRRRQNLPELLKTARSHLQERRLDEAEATFNQVLEAEPKQIDALSGLAEVLHVRKDFEGAIRQYRKALRIQPSAVTYIDIGNVLMDARRYAEAEQHYREAISLYPRLALAYSNLGAVMDAKARFGEMETCLEEAIRLQPNLLMAHDNLLFCLSYMPGDHTGKYLRAARRYGEIVARQSRPYTDWPVDASAQDGPLTVGIVSGDLRNHPVGYFVEGVLANLNTGKIRVNVYYTRRQEDEMSQRLKAHCTSWTRIADLSDADAAGVIRDDKVHILIDLAGHSAFNRLALFAFKPAPIAISWLGYFASTGLTAIDYVLTDSVAAPPGEEAQFVENVYPLPETRLCFTPPPAATTLPVGALPSLQQGHITFGSFQHPRKLNTAVLQLWAKVLDAVPGSRLLLKHPDFAFPESADMLLARMVQHGIAADRIIPESVGDYADYLQSYHRVDMVLDTFPFPGGTTTCEAMWMGVPTLTLKGYSMLSRQGESLMTNAGLSDWIADNPEDYVSKAVAFTRDLSSLATLRQGLRERVQHSPLMDAPRFARHLEAALSDIWSRRSIG
jgi:protein O-GlcNAc transferase